MAVVLFSPAKALSAVSGIHETIWIIVVGLVCTLYTSIGGLKAVVWADTLQAVFMYGGIIVMLIRGVSLSGGIDNVWRVLTEEDPGRVAVFSNWNPNPLQHHSMLISIFGGFCFWMTLYGLNQMALQRYCSMPTLRHSRIVVLMTVPMFMILGSLACFIGVVMLAFFYQKCDPLLDERMDAKTDHLVILFAVRTLRAIPGLPGLFLATLFSATLSTFSSAMNSQAAVLWEDFLKPPLGHRINDDTTARLNKFLVIGFGALATGMAFLAILIGDIVKSAFTLIGALGGPLIGCFFLGVFVPFANKYGVFVGLAVAGAINIGIPLGNIITKPYAKYRYSLNESCLDTPAETLGIEGDTSVFFPFRISIYLYALMGIIVTMVIGALVSLCWKDAKCDDADERKMRKQLTVYRSHERQTVYDVEMRNHDFNKNVPAYENDSEIDSARKRNRPKKEYESQGSAVTFH